MVAAHLVIARSVATSQSSHPGYCFPLVILRLTSSLRSVAARQSRPVVIARSAATSQSSHPGYLTCPSNPAPHLVIAECGCSAIPPSRHCDEYIFLVECVRVVYDGAPPRHCEERSDVAIHLKFKLAKYPIYKNKKAT